MDSLYKLTCEDFSKELFSKAPVPGGGGAAAYIGALGVSLGAMAVNLTRGKKKFAAFEPEYEQMLTDAELYRKRLLELIDKDAAAFEPLSKAYSLPKDAPDRDGILEAALLRAAASPLKIAELCCEVIEILEGCASLGSLLVLSDAASGAALAEGALHAAVINVKVNTALMHSRSHAVALNARMEEMEKEYAARAAAIRVSLGY